MWLICLDKDMWHFPGTLKCVTFMHLNVYINHSLFLIHAVFFFFFFSPGKNLDPRGGCCVVIQGGDAGEGPIPRRLLPLVQLQPPPALGQTLPVRPCPSLGSEPPDHSSSLTLTLLMCWHFAAPLGRKCRENLTSNIH